MSTPSIRTRWLEATVTGLPAEATTLTLAVALALHMHMNGAGVCWPSTQRIAGLARCSKRAAAQHVAVIEKAGFLRVERRNGAANRYSAIVPTGDLTSPVTSGHRRTETRQPVILNAPTGDLTSPEPGNQVNLGGPSGAARPRGRPASGAAGNDALHALVDAVTNRLRDFEETHLLDLDRSPLTDAFETAIDPGGCYWDPATGARRQHVDPGAHAQIRATCAEVDAWLASDGTDPHPLWLSALHRRLVEAEETEPPAATIDRREGERCLAVTGRLTGPPAPTAAATTGTGPARTAPSNAAATAADPSTRRT